MTAASAPGSACAPAVSQLAVSVLGYAHVSTTGHDLDAQLAALIAAGVGADGLFTDQLSGSARTARPGLAAMLDYARVGDIVVVRAIDRLGRSIAEVTRTIAEPALLTAQNGDLPPEDFRHADVLVEFYRYPAEHWIHL